MFESALEQNIPRRQLGRGAILSIAAHGVLIGLALYISSRPSTHGQEKLREVTFFNPPPPPPPPPPPAGGGSTAKKTEAKKIIKKPDTVIETKKTDKIPDKAPDPTPTPAEPGGQAGGVPGGVAGGVQGGVVGGTVGGVVGGTVGGVLGGTGNGNEVIPFGAGMVKPSLVHPPEITFSKEALAMRVGGLALVQCVVNLDGSSATVTSSRACQVHGAADPRGGALDEIYTGHLPRAPATRSDDHPDTHTDSKLAFVHLKTRESAEEIAMQFTVS